MHESRKRKPDTFQCPSAQPDMEGAAVFGIIGGDSGNERAAYFDARIPVSQEVLELTMNVNPLAVYRIAAKCEHSRCMHFNGHACELARRIVQLLPSSVEQLPQCSIRTECRWFAQEGSSACVRCPQILTLNNTDDPLLFQVASPSGQPAGSVGCDGVENANVPIETVV
jgi:hypothetical protein